MTPVPEAVRVGDNVVAWEGFNPDVRCDCGSSACRVAEGWLVFDPVPLAERAWAELLAEAPLFAVALTSGNHQRESLEIRARHGVAIHAPTGACGEIEADVWVSPGSDLGGFRLIDLPGGAAGESAWYDGGTLVVGDALIHLKGLEWLPDQYCTDAVLLKKSAAALAPLDVERVCFAHGRPLAGRDVRAVWESFFTQSTHRTGSAREI